MSEQATTTVGVHFHSVGEIEAIVVRAHATEGRWAYGVLDISIGTSMYFHDTEQLVALRQKVDYCIREMRRVELEIGGQRALETA